MRWAAVLVLGACTRAAAPAPCPAAPAVAALGSTFTLESKVLGQTRVINVYVPPGYADAKDAYPVLYMPDGGMGEDFPHVVGSVDVSIKNAVIRPVIVVGVENIERRHDLVAITSVPEEQEAAPHAGGADAFRAFLRDELQPWVGAHFRVTGESALIGESLAGLFAVETFLVEPTLFDSYIAADPSLWWNHHVLVDSAADRFAAWTAGPRRLYFTSGSDSDMADALDVLTTALAAAPADVVWTYEPMPSEQHATIFPTTALHGVRAVFAP